MDRKYPNALAYIKIEAVIRVKQKLWAVKIWAKMIWKQPSSLLIVAMNKLFKSSLNSMLAYFCPPPLYVSYFSTVTDNGNIKIKIKKEDI